MSEPQDQDGQVAVADRTEESNTAPVVTAAPAPAIPAMTDQESGDDLRSAILGQTTLVEEPLYVVEWKRWVIIRELDGVDRFDLLSATENPQTGKRNKMFYPMIAIACCIDPKTGNRIFKPSDRDELNRRGGTALERICQVAVRVCGLSADTFAAAKNA